MTVLPIESYRFPLGSITVLKPDWKWNQTD